jgi:hypothetical protein
MASALLIGACHAPTDGVDDLDRYQSVFESVNDANLMQRMSELTGATPVMAGGKTFRITNRWAPAAKSDFRAYWKQSMEALGATVNETTFPISNLVGETTGHNMEAILPGTSPDTEIIITHYDTVGITGHETENPGADDAGTGLATQLEAARIFAAIPNRTNTVRFVACDYEEISGDTDSDFPGPDAYLAYIKNLSTTQVQDPHGLGQRSDGLELLGRGPGDLLFAGRRPEQHLPNADLHTRCGDLSADLDSLQRRGGQVRLCQAGHRARQRQHPGGHRGHGPVPLRSGGLSGVHGRGVGRQPALR